MGKNMEVDESVEQIQTVPQLVAIDFDRTLADVAAALTRLYAVAETYGIDKREIEAKRIITEDDGGTFDPLSLIEEKLPPEKVAQFRDDFIARKGPPLLYDDSLIFLQGLEESRMPYHLLTYGVNPKWQELKIRASGFVGDVTIMDHPRKGEAIAKWRQPDGRYGLRQGNKLYVANYVCLIDDKATAFTSLPEGSSGFLVQRSIISLPSQRGALPPGIVKVFGLTELIVKQGRITKKYSASATPQRPF
jgi:hypothetical protein